MSSRPQPALSSDSVDSLDQPTVLLTPMARARAVEATLPKGVSHDDEGLDGEVIGHYHVRELIGRGSFGAVYRAVDPRLGREVAIKVAEGRVAEDPHLRELFWNEARIQARLEHSNIVPIYDILEEPGRLSLVMRLIHGEDLDKRLRQMVRPFTPSETLRLMRQVSSAVGSAHARGVIHQDLKPGNIRLTPDAEAVVLDFGVARIAGETCGGRPEASGTPAYMAPEQIRGEAIDARSDIYALAMTLYKTLTGHHPFETAVDLEQLLEWQVERIPPSPTDFNPHLPPALADTILQGLAKDPRDRFRACADFTRAVSVSLGMDDSPAVAEKDARWDPRARVRLAAKLMFPGEDAFDARVLDLSTSGAALRVSRPLKEGSVLGIVIRVPLKNSEHLVRCSMRVVRVMPEPERQDFRVGVAFECIGNFDRAVLSDLVRAVLIYNGTR